MESNGTYGFQVGHVSGYKSTPQNSSVNVTGKAVQVAVTFYQPSRTFVVTFAEWWLPTGTAWSVTLNGDQQFSTGSTMQFDEINGTYSFSVGTVIGYTSSPGSGTVVVNGGSVSKAIAFALIPSGQYQVVFNETGLPSGTNWSLTLGGVEGFSTGASIEFMEKNGTYQYTVAQIATFSVTPQSGTVSVSGMPAAETIVFVPQGEYAITFSEGGLPSATAWSVVLAGVTLSSTDPMITFTELNGTYSYMILVVPGYTSSPFLGSVNTSGQAVSVPVEFTRSSSVSATSSGLFFGLSMKELYLTVAVVIAVVVVVCALVLPKRKTEARKPLP
jgi:hypothetical protein